MVVEPLEVEFDLVEEEEEGAEVVEVSTKFQAVGSYFAQTVAVNPRYFYVLNFFENSAWNKFQFFQVCLWDVVFRHPGWCFSKYELLEIDGNWFFDLKQDIGVL